MSEEHKKGQSFTGFILVMAIIFIVAIAVGVYKVSLGAEDTLVATINGEDLYMSEVDDRYGELPEEYQQALLKNDFIQSLIDELVLDMAAQERGISISTKELDDAYVQLLAQRDLPREAFLKVLKEEDKTEQEILNLLEKKLRIEKLIIDLANSITMSNESLKKIYEQNKKAFSQEESVGASHILVETEEEALELIKKLEEGSDFEALAIAHSTDPTAQRNKGSLGFFGRGQMVKPFEDAVFALEAGEISEPVKSQFGWHVIQGHGKKAAEKISFEDVKNQLRERVLQSQREQILQSFLDKKFKDYNVVIHYEGLKKQDLVFE